MGGGMQIIMWVLLFLVFCIFVTLGLYYGTDYCMPDFLYDMLGDDKPDSCDTPITCKDGKKPCNGECIGNTEICTTSTGGNNLMSKKDDNAECDPTSETNECKEGSICIGMTGGANPEPKPRCTKKCDLVTDSNNFWIQGSNTGGTSITDKDCGGYDQVQYRNSKYGLIDDISPDKTCNNRCYCDGCEYYGKSRHWNGGANTSGGYDFRLFCTNSEKSQDPDRCQKS